MISFKQFLAEKDVSDVKEPTLYIACELPQEYWNKQADLVPNLSDAVEIEDDPHCTFLWCMLEDDYETDYLYDMISPLLKDLSFKLDYDGFEVFEGVSDGTQDCAVVRLKPPQDIIDLQSKVIQTLKDNGVKFNQTYKDWKPHCTLGYFKNGTKIERMNKKGRTPPVETQRIYMDHNNNGKVDF